MHREGRGPVSRARIDMNYASPEAVMRRWLQGYEANEDMRQRVCLVIAKFVKDLIDAGLPVAMLEPMFDAISNSRKDRTAERRRAFIVADWAIREVAPPVLTWGFCPKEAARLQELPQIIDVGTAKRAAAVAEDASAAGFRARLEERCVEHAGHSVQQAAMYLIAAEQCDSYAAAAISFTWIAVYAADTWKAACAMATFIARADARAEWDRARAVPYALPSSYGQIYEAERRAIASALAPLWQSAMACLTRMLGAVAEAECSVVATDPVSDARPPAKMESPAVTDDDMDRAIHRVRATLVKVTS